MRSLLTRLFSRRPQYTYQGRFDSRVDAIAAAKNLQDYGSKSYDSRAIKKLKFDEQYTQGRNMIVPLILSTLDPKQRTILDVGGGVNAVFSHLNQTQKQQHQCFVLERGEVVQELNNNIPKTYQKQLHYVDSIDEIKTIDIAYFGSSIQYVNEYETLLHQIAKLAPQFIIFSESVFTQDSEDYFVLQVNMSPNTFPNRFISEQKLTAMMSQLNYQCTYNKAVSGDFSHQSIKRNAYECKTLIFKRH